MARGEDHVRAYFLIVFLAFSALLAVGVLGYRIVEGWSWFDALYMTIITFSTVGFREVQTLDPAGRVLTMVVTLFGLVVIALLSASVTSLLVRRELLPMFKHDPKTRIDELRGHTILCGGGETGKTVVDEFRQSQRPLVVIERDEAAVASLREAYPDLPAIHGDATKDEVLQEAGIARAAGLVSALTADADNLFVVISARALNPALTIVARAIDAHTARKMYKAGATHVVSPKITEGARMAAVVLRPTVVSFLDVTMRGEGAAFRLEEVTVPEGSPLDGKTLREIEIPQRTGLIVIAVAKRDAGEQALVYNPQSSTKVQAGDRFIVLGDMARIDMLTSLMR